MGNDQKAAFHEAGHAVAAVILKIPLVSTAIGDSQSEGGPHRLGGWTVIDFQPTNADEAFRYAVFTYAGIAAQCRESKPGFTDSDFAKVYESQTDDGQTLANLARYFQPLSEWEGMKPRAIAKARDLIEQNWATVEKIAKELLKKKSLSGDDAHKIAEEGKGEGHLRLIYEKAQDSAENNDAVMWEVTAIIWSANVLMLGFSFEARPGSGEFRVLLASILSMFLTTFASWNYEVMREARNQKYRICQDIERELDIPPRSRIHCLQKVSYPRGFQTAGHRLITVTFLAVWAAILFEAVGKCNSAWGVWLRPYIIGLAVILALVAILVPHIMIRRGRARVLLINN